MLWNRDFSGLPIIPFACPCKVPSPVPNLMVDRNVCSKGAEFCNLGLPQDNSRSALLSCKGLHCSRKLPISNTIAVKIYQNITSYMQSEKRSGCLDQLFVVYVIVFNGFKWIQNAFVRINAPGNGKMGLQQRPDTLLPGLGKDKTGTATWGLSASALSSWPR